jgi:hypothetical protein
MIAEQPRSLLGGLDLDTAIRLRWALRDIKAKRTKLAPDKFLKPSPHKRRKSGHAGSPSRVNNGPDDPETPAPGTAFPRGFSAVLTPFAL